jgi:hypothetical protein
MDLFIGATPFLDEIMSLGATPFSVSLIYDHRQWQYGDHANFWDCRLCD